MSRDYSKFLTANDLRLGDVVYWAADQRWARDITDAVVFSDSATAEAALAAAFAQSDLVVGPYLVDAITTETGPAPAHFREAFRMRGPSNYPHGKQEQAQR
ncbi:MAG: DUF2849 domain-containing protein [Paracoccaceae bacterium]|uniref:DUF2849 domain-containing protein n=1 Tax=unclassified Roseobacter TaxID=196798 RepID=UPI0030EDC104